MAYDEKVQSVIHGKSSIRIGRKGITNNVIAQIETLLKKREVIKVKFLNYLPFKTVKEAFDSISASTNSKVIDIRGKTGVLIRTNTQKEIQE